MSDTNLGPVPEHTLRWRPQLPAAPLTLLVLLTVIWSMLLVGLDPLCGRTSPPTARSSTAFDADHQLGGSAPASSPVSCAPRMLAAAGHTMAVESVMHAVPAQPSGRALALLVIPELVFLVSRRVHDQIRRRPPTPPPPARLAA